MWIFDWLLRIDNRRNILSRLNLVARSKGTATETGTNRSGFVVILCSNQSFKNLVGCFHGHATEIGYQVCAVSMAGKATF